jgi:glycosyltransferase involved in cell wall biosynthesis
MSAPSSSASFSPLPAPPAAGEPPLVSVVIPCYGQAHYLPEAVASVVAQSYPAREILIVDDGSPDDTSEVARALIARNAGENISLQIQANGGLGAARNQGIRRAQGVYFVPLDADDTLGPDMLARCVAALQRHPEAGFVYTDAQFFGVDTRVYRPGPFDRRRLAFNNPLMPHALVRREVWREAGGYAARGVVPGVEDWDLWLSAIEAGWQGHYLPEALVGYRRRDGSMLADAHRRDLWLRARLVLRHQALYPRPFLAWATRVATEPHPRRSAWIAAYAAYLALIARFYPPYLPKALARPLYARLPASRQGRLRRLVRR